MNQIEPPLLSIFNHLRNNHHLPLGIEEYLVVIQGLRSGLGIENYQALVGLCCTIWATSEQEVSLIRRVFYQIMPPSSEPQAQLPVRRKKKRRSHVQNKPNPTASLPEASRPNEAETLPSTALDPLATLPSSTSRLTLSSDDPIQVVQAIRSRLSSSFEPGLLRSISLPVEYLPVTYREMKQQWRYLRRYVREGPSEELDVEATITKIEREGVLSTPVLVPRRRNRAELVLLIDQGGSMMPFHWLTRALIETAKRGGRLGQVGAYFFHDYPHTYLYRDPTRLEAQPLDDVLHNINERAAILIVSDAGAARGFLDLDRVKHTHEFIQQLHRRVRYYAWLNPFDNKRWKRTTADEIARFIPMFDVSRQGLQGAISAIRGRSIY